MNEYEKIETEALEALANLILKNAEKKKKESIAEQLLIDEPTENSVILEEK